MCTGEMTLPFLATFTWNELILAVGGTVLQQPVMAEGQEDSENENKNIGRGCFSPSTDTRTIQKGAVYIPIVGERFDGHAFLQKAIEAGAGAVLIQSDKKATLPEDMPASVGVIEVDHTTEAYLALGRYHRRRCQAAVIALTGSSGKTTTKEMMFQALSPYFKTQCTQKNFNNEMGVAQTLLGLHPETEVLIVEMGMRGLNEIDLLSRYAEPHISVVVNVGPAHIGRLGSLENIATAKSEVVEGLTQPEEALKEKFDALRPVCVFDGDSPYLADALGVRQSKKISARKSRAEKQSFDLAPVYLDAVHELQVQGGHTYFALDGEPFELSQPGEHLAKNTQLIVQVARRLGLSTQQIKEALSTPLASDGRWEQVEKTLRDGNGNTLSVTVINDAYNANPQSMGASLRTLHQLLEEGSNKSHNPDDANNSGESGESGGLEHPERVIYPILVFGGMKELGEQSDEYHQSMGELLEALPALHGGEVLVVGAEAKPLVDKLLSIQADCFAVPVTYWPVESAPTEEQWEEWLQHNVSRWMEFASQKGMALNKENKQNKETSLLVWLKGSRSYQLERFISCLQ